MKKNLFLLVLLLLTVGSRAQNKLTVSETTIPQNGGELMIALQLGTADVYTSYQFKVDTPDGVVYATDELDDVECSLGAGYDASHQSTVHWSAAEQQLAVGVISTKTALLKGTTVELAIPIAAMTAEVGAKLVLTFKGITFIQQSGVKDLLDDVVVTLTVGEPDDGRVKFDENATRLPKYEAGQKGNVSMRRTIKGGRWSTIVLPFTLTKAKAEAAFGSDVQLAEFTGFETTYADEDDVTPDAIQINLSTYAMTARKGMTGGKPYFIKTSADIDGFTADDVTLVSAVSADDKSDEWDTPGRLTGTLVKSTIPTDGLFLSGGNFWYSTGKSAVKAFRCWLELGAVLDKETDFGARVMLNIDGGSTTAVGTVATAGARADGKVYNLGGQRVSRTGRGVYIVNGKKVVK